MVKTTTKTSSKKTTKKPAATKKKISSKATKVAKVTKATKATKKSSKVKTSVAETPVETVVEEKVVETTVATPAPTPAPAPAPEAQIKVVAPTALVAVVETEDDIRLKELENRMSALVSALQGLRVEAQNIVVLSRSLKTDVTKMVKGLVKDKKKYQKKRRSKPRAPSGFAKPTYLSLRLCKFLNIPHDTMLARTEVTRKVNAYIKEHGLQNPANKKEIVADTELKKILIFEDGVPLTYFNLQKAIKTNFSSTPFEVSA